MLLPKIPKINDYTFDTLSDIESCIFENQSTKLDIVEESLKDVNVLDFVQHLVENNFLICVIRDGRCFLNWANELRFDYVNHCVYLPFVKYSLCKDSMGLTFPYNLEASLELLHTDEFLSDVIYCYDGKHTVYRYTRVKRLNFDVNNIDAKGLYRLWLNYTVYTDTSAENNYVVLTSNTPLYRSLRKAGYSLYKAVRGKHGALASYTLERLLTEEAYGHYDPVDLGLNPEIYDKPPNYYKIIFDIVLYSIFYNNAGLIGIPNFEALGKTKEYIGISIADMPTMYLKHVYKRDTQLPCMTYDFCIDINKLIQEEGLMI